MTHEVRIALTVPSLRDSVEFYRKSFRLELGDAWDFNGKGQTLPAGNAVIEVLDERHADFVNASEGSPGHREPVRLAIGVSDLVHTLKLARKFGGIVVWGPEVTPWGDTNARVRAPEGQIITVFERH